MQKRHSNILDLARRDGVVRVEALAKNLSVTPQTIRRDIGFLVKQGLIERIHGGAKLTSGLRNIAYDQRRALNEIAKSRIGEACATEIKNRSTLFLGIGTTCEAVARALIHHEGLLVMTNNLNAVPILSAGGKNNVLVTGGRLRQADGGLVGPTAVNSLKQFKFDHAIIGCSALDEKGGILTTISTKSSSVKPFLKTARRRSLLRTMQSLNAKPPHGSLSYLR